MKKLILLMFLIVSLKSTAQTKKSDGIRLHVLRLNKIGKVYKFNTEDSTTTYLKYLGKLNTSKGKTYKVMTSIWIWGLSHRATNRILIYTDKNRYVGNYYLTLSTDLPNYIKNNQLIFNNVEPDCDSHLITIINFKKGILKDFFRKCKGDSGDIYSFSKD